MYYDNIIFWLDIPLFTEHVSLSYKYINIYMTKAQNISYACGVRFTSHTYKPLLFVDFADFMGTFKPQM